MFFHNLNCMCVCVRVCADAKTAAAKDKSSYNKQQQQQQHAYYKFLIHSTHTTVVIIMLIQSCKQFHLFILQLCKTMQFYLNLSTRVVYSVVYKRAIYILYIHISSIYIENVRRPFFCRIFMKLYEIYHFVTSRDIFFPSRKHSAISLE